MSELSFQGSLECINGLSTIRDWMRWTSSRFNEHDLFYGHGSNNSWDESAHLLLQALNLPWNIPNNFYDSALTDEEKQHLHTLIKKRIIDKIPVPYLVNQAWFCNLPFYVDPRVIIPRSPIASLIKDRLSPWLDEQVEVKHILDLCCGSGCIGISAITQFPDSKVDLIDISQDALQVAHINTDKHQCWQQVRLIQSDLFSALKTQTPQKYELILSNPPYVDAEDMDDLPAEYHHEPTLALLAGPDGLGIIHRIFKDSADFLTPNGILVAEVGNSQFALQSSYPNIDFEWIEPENGGHGLFVLTYEQCKAIQPQASDYVASTET